MTSLPTRRHALGLVGLGAFGALLAACSSESSGDEAATTGTGLPAIQNNGTLRIGMEGTFRPYGYHDDSGELVGFEKEIGDLIAQDLGVKAKYVETQWDSLIAGVDAGRYDIIINNISATDERKAKFDFSIPYAESQGKVGVVEDSPMKTTDEISGHSAAQTETSNFGQQMAAEGANLVPVTGFDEAAMLVSFGRVDMTGNDFVTFQAFFEQRPDHKIRLLDGNLGDPSQAAVLMGKGQEQLKQAIDQSLKKHMDDGDLKNIYQKYVQTDLTPTSATS
ncbi:transporter substrate-binding domain-containing protein [Rothia uropygialis]|uniref:transporter substrate-binding domain-containing protein n=1 Tax=Kocuria sp. 36 TaxID=1415402 RepID=UPI00101C8586|nr:transporter substrate-binding domain-containing protein [Kocuria sp. 36]